MMGRRPALLALLAASLLASPGRAAPPPAAAGTAPAPAGARPVRFLLTIASASGVGETPLRHADDDARRIEGLFRDLGEVPADRAHAARAATPDAVRRALAAVAAEAARHPPADVTLIVYYSGHGAGDWLHLEGRALAVDELLAWVDAVPAGLRVVLLDACRTGGFARTKGFVDREPFDIAFLAPAGPQGTVVVRSTSDGEAAHESDRLGGGVFTHYLASALRGAADADGDARVTLGEAYTYAYRHTLQQSARAGVVQHPELEAEVVGAGELVLTWTRAAAVTLVLPPGGESRYLVYRQPAGAVMAEVWGRRDGPVEVALPAGRYLVQRLGPDRFGAAEIAIPWGGSRAVDASEFRDVPYERLAQRGGAVLARRHELAVLAGGGPGVAAGLGGRLSLGYLRRLDPRWALALRVDAGLRAREDRHFDVRERWVGGSALLQWRADLGPLTGELAGGGTVRGLFQEQARRDDGLLEGTGYRRRWDYRALAGGGLVRAGLRLPFAERLWVGLGAELALLGVREGDAPALRAEGDAEVSLGVRF